MKVLLHICCAHCMEAALNGLREEFADALEVEGYFYNPNIHPLLEFRKRLKAVKVANEALRIPVRYHEDYGLEVYLREIWDGGAGGRCRRCYDERLKAIAQLAAEAGFEVFTSTLCTSRQQDHAAIRQAGEAAAEAWALAFLYRDWRDQARVLRKRPGIYRQQYCGCIFSEAERYAATGQELYRGPGG
jgi:hypothetical protein